MSYKEKIVFCCNVNDEYYHSMGAAKLVASARYFHPDIPFVVFGTEEMNNRNVPLEIMMPFIMRDLINRYEKVVRFDADSMIVGPLDELINAEGYDIIGVRNNNDYDRAGKDSPITQFNVSVSDYMNAGLVATTSEAFLAEWMDVNLSVGTLLPFVEQTVLNGIRRKYKTLILDPKESDVYYGVSCLFGEDTHWDSWKHIHVVNKDLYLNGKKVKVLHHGGGFNPNKLGFYMFNKETRKRLIEITS